MLPAEITYILNRLAQYQKRFFAAKTDPEMVDCAKKMFDELKRLSKELNREAIKMPRNRRSEFRSAVDTVGNLTFPYSWFLRVIRNGNRPFLHPSPFNIPQLKEKLELLFWK